MDIVTVAIAMALGATLTSLASVLIVVIKRRISEQDENNQPAIKTFDYREISNLTTEELDKIINDLEQIKLNKLKTQTGN